MLSQELKPRREAEWREDGGATTRNGHVQPQPPLVINSHFIVSDFHPLREDKALTGATAATNEGPQQRWEETAKSTRTERGSVSSAAQDANLVLTSTEYRGGIVIRRFRTSHRLEADAETKSVSNRSMVSESSHLNSVSFRPFKPAEEIGELVLKRFVPETPPVQDDTKSEQMGVGGSVQQEDPSEPPMPPQRVHLPPQVSDDLIIEHKLNGFGAKHAHGTLEGLGLETVGREHVRSPALPTKPAVNLSDPRTASGMLKGEIAEADLLLENLGRFEGELVDGRMHGYGRLFDQQNRLLFEGDFVDNEYEGVGILHNQLPEGSQGLTGEVDWTTVDWRSLTGLWTRYEGLFKGGRFHGSGNLFFGTRYVLSSVFENGETGREVLARDLGTQRSVRVRRDAGRSSKSN